MSDTEKRMKIISLTAENVKRLSAVAITPDGNLVEIVGKNGSGKTSVLDSLWWALDGSGNVQSDPIRHGADEARITVRIGDGLNDASQELIVKRIMKRREDGSVNQTLTVEGGQGARFMHPQKMLDGLCGALTFDPLQFQRMKAGEKFDALKSFVPGVDFEAIEAANKQDFKNRQDLNREAKQLESAAAQISVDPDDLTEMINVDALVDEMAAVADANALLAKRRQKREQAAADIERLRQSARDRRSEADRLNDLADNDIENAVRLSDQLAQADPLPEDRNIEEIRARIATAQLSNKRASDHKRKVELLVSAAEIEKQAQALTDAMDQREAEKERAIAKAEMPIRGLSFDGPIVTLNGVPFEQGSDAEQLRASVAIAAALNPQLRIIRVRDGSLLDSDGMKMLAKFANEKDFQIWIERVSSDAQSGIIIEDGHVKGQNPDDILSQTSKKRGAK